MTIDGSENLRLILDRWTEGLAEVFESMAEQRPEVAWRATSGSLTEIGIPSGAGADQEVLWWEQPFQVAADMVFWVAAPRATWEYAGGLVLKAAGIDTIEPAEARNTWLEVLGQSLGTMARALSGLLGREVTLAAGVERGADREVREWASVSMNFRDTALAPVLAAMSAPMLNLLATSRPAEPENHEPASNAQDEEPRRGSGSRTIDLLMDVDLPVSISFGKTQLPLRDVLKLTTGSIVELNRGINDQVEVLVNRCLIARGEVVVVEGNYGVRIQEITKRHDRLRSLQ